MPNNAQSQRAHTRPITHFLPTNALQKDADCTRRRRYAVATAWIIAIFVLN